MTAWAALAFGLAAIVFGVWLWSPFGVIVALLGSAHVARAVTMIIPGFRQ